MAVKKKSAKKKVAAKKKSAAKKPAKQNRTKKKTAVRAARKSSSKPAARNDKPGSAASSGRTPSRKPPVEEPVQPKEAIGIVTHYYSHLGVALVQLIKGTLRTGDRILVRGHASDFSQTVGSMEYEHQHVDQAEAGQCVGIKAVDQAREHDIVYLVK